MNGSEVFLALLISSGLAAAGESAVPMTGPGSVATLKFATLAPDGSTWMRHLREMDRSVREKSGGRLAFKFYPGGVSGDEKDVVSKMRIGQLQAGGFTGLGLGEMAPEERVLETPFLTQDESAAMRVADGLKPEIAAYMKKKGFVLLAWAHPGFAYFMTREPVKDLAGLKKLKIWAWEGDPIAAALFDALGIAPIPLSLPDVLTSLQTGLIHGAYATPLAAIALQWHTQVRYFLQMPVAFVSGALVVTAAAYDKLPADLQKLLVDECEAAAVKLAAATRKENIEAIAAIGQSGVQIVAPPPDTRKPFEAAAMEARKKLSGTLFPAELLEKAISLAGR